MTRTFLSVSSAALLWLLPAKAWSQDPPRPGEKNPIQNPSRYTLFHDDEAFLPAQLDMMELILKPEGKQLDKWSSKEQPNGKGQCRYGARRFAAGRVVSPLRDQLVCATNYKVELVGDTSLSFKLPTPALPITRPVSVAVGDLDRLVDAEGQSHDEIAVTYAVRGNRVRLLVLDYRFQLLASIDTEKESRGDAAVALGDLDGDGALELALATGDANPEDYGGPRPDAKGLLTLSTYRLRHDGKSPAVLERADSRAEAIAGAPYSLGLVAADLNGDGVDELALTHYPLRPDGVLKLQVFQADKALKPLLKSEASLGAPAPMSYASLTAGLLRYEPASGYSIDRRQLAVAMSLPDGKAQVTALDINDDLSKIVSGPALSLEGPLLMGAHGPGIAAGNYVGLADPQSPRMVLALNLPLTGDGTSVYPRFAALKVKEGPVLSLERVAEKSWPEYTSRVDTWSQEIVAWDGEGRALYLGTPIHLTLNSLLHPEYVVQEPPKHVDYLPVDPNDWGGSWEVVNVSGSNGFYVELRDTQGNTVQHSSTDTTSWNIGGSASSSSSGTVSAGLSDIAEVSVSAGLTLAVGYDYEQNTSKTNSQYKSVTTSQTDQTTTDDHLLAFVRQMDIWRYPVFGLKVEKPAGSAGTGAPLQGFYEVVLPGPTLQVSGAGRNQDWYQPPHQNDYLLSYPALNDPRFPGDLGVFTPKGGRPTRSVLNVPSTYYWDGNFKTFSMEWSEQSGKEVSKQNSSTLRESADMRLGFSGSARVYAVNVSAEQQFTFNFHNSNSWSQNTVSREEISSSRGISLTKPGEGVPEQAYAFKSVIYVTDQGGLKVAHAVDPTGSPSGATWWKSYYAGRPDPALNLPNRMVYKAFQWQLNSSPSGQQLRGLFLRSPKNNPATGERDYLSDALTAGQGVELVARVYNFSLGQKAGPFSVLFQYAEIDPATDKIIGEVKTVGTVETTLDPLQMRELSIPWDTSTLGGASAGMARYYRIMLTVDPDDRVPGEIHELKAPGGNNEGYWPWTGGIAVFNKEAPVSTTVPKEALLADVSMDGEALVMETAPGQLTSTAASVKVGGSYRLRARIKAARNDKSMRFLFFHEGAPDQGGKLIAMKTVGGLASGDNYVWTDWTPTSPGTKRLQVTVLESGDDPISGNALDTLDVTAAP